MKIRQRRFGGEEVEVRRTELRSIDGDEQSLDSTSFGLSNDSLSDLEETSQRWTMPNEAQNERLDPC